MLNFTENNTTRERKREKNARRKSNLYQERLKCRVGCGVGKFTSPTTHDLHIQNQFINYFKLFSLRFIRGSVFFFFSFSLAISQMQHSTYCHFNFCWCCCRCCNCLTHELLSIVFIHSSQCRNGVESGKKFSLPFIYLEKASTVKGECTDLLIECVFYFVHLLLLLSFPSSNDFHDQATSFYK